MHNSTFKNQGKGLARTAFKRAAPKPKSQNFRKIEISKDPKPRATLKSKPTKTSKIRQSARHEVCTIRLMGACRTDPGNVVWAHSNRAEHGKGGGLKADDEWGAYACFWCHCIYDRQHKRPAGMTLEYVEDQFTAGMHESRAKLRIKGLLK